MDQSNQRVSLLGRKGHGQQTNVYTSQPRLPSLDTNLHLASRCQDAAPYVRHLAQAAPYLAAGTPDPLVGLLTPSIASPKPPAARRSPTRTNLFKTTRTLSLDTACGACPITNGTIIVTNLATVPPTTYLCATATVCDCEILVPYDTLSYQVDPATQFSLASNAAFSISLEITSLAANGPLNGQATSAHVMDIDDICTYSSGSYEQRSTTPCDAVDSVSLAKGLTGIMGPESYTQTLIHPRHCGTKAYPGWSYAFKTSQTKPFKIQGDVVVSADGIYADFCQATPHRWFVDTTFDISATLYFDSLPASSTQVELYLVVVNGACPPAGVNACSSEFRDSWIDAHTQYIQIGTANYSRMCPKEDDHKSMVTSINNTAFNNRKKKRDRVQKLVCKSKKKCDEEEEEPCLTLEPFSDKCPDPSEGIVDVCCRQKKPKVTVSLGDDPTLNTITVHGKYTTCDLQNAIGVVVIPFACDNTLTPKCARFEVNTFSPNPEQQFGPMIVTRLQGLTKDINIQLTQKAAVSGIQTGAARAVAPPTGPSLLTLGDEEAVLTQALFDAPGSQVCRIWTGDRACQLLNSVPSQNRELAAAHMEAAPIGDTIRNIANTISGIGKSLGGPFSTIGDIIGTVGNVAGGIGDTIGSIFSAPAAPASKRPRLYAAPINPIINATTDFPQPAVYNDPIPEPLTVKAVTDTTRTNYGWSLALNQDISGRGPRHDSSGQAFPWIAPEDGEGGISHVYVTTGPLKMTGRTPKYAAYANGRQTVMMDPYLYEANQANYVSEALLAAAAHPSPLVFITTDATEPIFGDSFAAAILAAIYQPTLSAAVTGGVTATDDGLIAITPVGLTTQKIQVAIETGFTLIAPVEPATTALRAGTDGTAIVHVSDILTGALTQTPNVILVQNLSDLLLALSFVKSTSSTPFGPEEQAEYDKLVKENQTKSAQVQASKEVYALKGATQEKYDQVVSTLFSVSPPGFDTQEIPLMDINWWKANSALLTNPPPDGMGVKQTAIGQYIEDGNVAKLTGIAMGILSRQLSARRKAEGATRRARTKSSRQPPYKRADKTAIQSLISTIRDRTGQRTTQQPTPQPPLPPEPTPPPPPPPTFPVDQPMTDLTQPGTSTIRPGGRGRPQSGLPPPKFLRPG